MAGQRMKIETQDGISNFDNVNKMCTNQAMLRDGQRKKKQTSYIMPGHGIQIGTYKYCKILQKK